MTKILGISGRAQSGKTTLANYIKEQLPHNNIVICSFADYLKDMMIDLFEFSNGALYDDYLKTQDSGWFLSQLPVIKNFTTENDKMTNRESMEYLGALVRQINQKGWINGVFSTIENNKYADLILIPDVRAPNEVEMIQSFKNGKVLRLTRNPLNRNTIIENALDKQNFDWQQFDAIINNYSMSVENKNIAGFNLLTELYGTTSK